MATPALPAHNMSTMYYDPGFALGEDIRDESREAQDEAWKHAVQDGRAHVSHREAAQTHAARLAASIGHSHCVEALIDCHDTKGQPAAQTGPIPDSNCGGVRLSRHEPVGNGLG